MLSILLSPWTIGTQTASIGWTIQDNSGDGIANVQYRIRKEGSDGSYLQSAGSTGSTSIDVKNYTGKVFFDMSATDFAGRTVTASSEVSVDNFVAPTPPDFLSYEQERTMKITFRWDALAISPTVTSWRVVNKRADGSTVILAERPVYERTADVVMDVGTLYQVMVYGVDSEGRTSAPSPSLSFLRDPNGPKIILEPWVLSAAEATIGWSIQSKSFLKSITYSVTDGTNTVNETALAEDHIHFPIPNFIGVVSITVTAVDSNDRRTTVVSQVQVYNKAPKSPQLVAELVGARFIRLKGHPAPNDTVPTTAIEIHSSLGVVTMYPPFIHTYENLTPRTDYSFSARSVNPSGLKSPFTSATLVRTSEDPFAPPPEIPTPGVGVAFVDRLIPLLEGDVREYLLQLYTDTRIRSPRTRQVIDQPIALDLVLDLFLPVSRDFGSIIRAETEDEETYLTSELIDKTYDPLEKLAIFCERLEFGSIWNLA